jgi:hypothetical protein
MELDLDLHSLAPPTELPVSHGDMGEADALKEELRETRRQLESTAKELARSRSSQSLLFATIDATADGIMAFQFSEGTPFYNVAFVTMWGIPEDILADLSQEEVMALKCAQAKYPAELMERTSAFDPTPKTSASSNSRTGGSSSASPAPSSCMAAASGGSWCTAM